MKETDSLCYYREVTVLMMVYPQREEPQVLQMRQPSW